MENNKVNTTGYPILMFGTDASIFDPTSDTAQRMQAYETYHSDIHIVTSASDKKGRCAIQLSEKTSVYPSRYTNKILALFGMYRHARQIMDEHNIRCVMSQDPFMLGLVAYLLTRKGKGVFSVGIYGTDPTNPLFRRESLKHRLYAFISHFILPRATAIQTDGPETVEHLTEDYGPKVFFKPMLPANIDVLGSRERATPNRSLKVLFMGRFVDQKNIPLLIEVIATSQVEHKGLVHFTAVGSGPQHAWFKSEIERRGLLGVCTIPGVVPRDAVPNLMTEHDVLLMVSHYEGFPRVFMEAAATGMPIVTTQVGGVKDLVTDGEGGYVLPQSTSAEIIAGRLAMLARDRNLLVSFSRIIKKRWDDTYRGKTVLDFQLPLVTFLGARLQELH